MARSEERDFHFRLNWHGDLYFRRRCCQLAHANGRAQQTAATLACEEARDYLRATVADEADTHRIAAEDQKSQNKHRL